MSSKKKLELKPVRRHRAGYPTKQEHNSGTSQRPSDARRLVDPSRRRFFGQAASVAGAVVVGPALTAHGQDMPEIDFSVLAEHDLPEADGSIPAESRRQRRAQGRDDSSTRSESETSEPVEDETNTDLAANTTTENRAVWVDPHFLVLVQMTRAEGDEAPIVALDGSSAALGERLATVTSEEVHDVEQLQMIEADLMTILAPVVMPAVIDVLHLDHNCDQLCAAPEGESTISVRGRRASPR